MPSTPYAKLLVSLNGGATQIGGVTAANGDTVQFSAESTAEWDLTTPPRWEIYAYPPTWTGPASGWTTESVASPFGGTTDVYVYSGLGPPPSFTLPALPMWGDFLCKLTVAGGLLNGLAASQLVDNSTALRIVGPGGLTDIAVGAESQFDTGRAWVGSWQDVLRILDAAVVGSATPYTSTPASVVIGAGTAGAVLQYAKGDHSHPVTVGAPTTIAIGDAAAAGGGTVLAGAAHVHALPVPTVINAVATSSSLGVSGVPAREDHAHELSFTTVNTILAGASAPITLNGQTLTAGGFIGPYYSTSASNPATTGLLRAAKNTVALAFRDDALAADINAVSMTTTDVLVFGATNAAETRLVTQSGGTIGLYDDATNIINVTLTDASWGSGATMWLRQTAGVGAGADAIVEAQGAGAAVSNGGNLVLKSGTAGALGSPGDIWLDAKANGSGTTSGRISMRGTPFSEFLRFSYDGSADRTLIEAGPAFTRWDTKILELKATNACLFASTGVYGGGTKVLSIANATTEPGDISTGYHVLYAYGDALKARGAALTVLAPVVDSAPGGEDLRAPDRRASRVDTTDATVTTAYTLAIPDNAVAFIKATVVAWSPDGGLSSVFEIRAGVKRFSAGVATLIGAVDVFAREDNAGTDATIDVDGGNNARVRVTGIVATNFNWFTTLDVTLMQP